MEFTLPGRVNNPYKDHKKVVVANTEDVYKELPPVPKSQGCVHALTAGYGTLEYCTQNGDRLPMPPRYVQFDTNVENIISTHVKQDIPVKVYKQQFDPIVLVGGGLFILWLLSRVMRQ
jgi:hypothetical protein